MSEEIQILVTALDEASKTIADTNALAFSWRIGCNLEIV
jgi:hypothetical protein